MVVAAIASTGAAAHDFGCDGRPVPASIKSECCGDADAHLLGAPWVNPKTGEKENWPLPRQNDKGDWVLDLGVAKGVWAATSVQPSPDGCFWAFWSQYDPSACSYEARKCHPTEDKSKWEFIFRCLIVPFST